MRAPCQQGQPCGDTDNCPDPIGCGHLDAKTTVEAGARFEFTTGHLIDIHQMWQGQWLYQVWPPALETQGQFDRLCRMKVADFENALRQKGGKRVR